MSETYPLIRLSAALVLMAIGGSAMYASVIVLEPTVQEFNTGRGVGSLLFGMFMFGIAFGGILMGRIADRVGIMTPAVIGSLSLPVGLFAAAHAGSIMELCVAFGFLCGFLGASFTFAPLLADISHWFTRKRGFAVGILFSGSYNK